MLIFEVAWKNWSGLELCRLIRVLLLEDHTIVLKSLMSEFNSRSVMLDSFKDLVFRCFLESKIFERNHSKSSLSLVWLNDRFFMVEHGWSHLFLNSSVFLICITYIENRSLRFLHGCNSLDKLFLLLSLSVSLIILPMIVESGSSPCRLIVWRDWNGFERVYGAVWINQLLSSRRIKSASRIFWTIG